MTSSAEASLARLIPDLDTVPVEVARADAAGWHGAPCRREGAGDGWFNDRVRDAAARAEADIASGLCVTECPHRDACLAKALWHEGELSASARYGIWGGKGPTERYAIARGLTIAEVYARRLHARYSQDDY